MVSDMLLAKRLKIVIFIFVITGLTSCHYFTRLSGNENNYKLTTVEELADTVYAQNIETFYDSGQEGYFEGKANVQIYYRIFEQPEAEKAIVISTGRTEAALKYKELIFDLFNNGYSIYIHDHRGQGLSDRMTNDRDMGYIDNFQFYIDDMKYFYDNYCRVKGYSKHYLLAHSMGGAIGMTYLQQYPEDFNAAAFSSPMLGLVPPICSMVKVFNNDTPKYALGETAYKDEKNKFKGNTLTGSEIRYNRMVEAFTRVPEARLGGVSYNWVHKSCQQFNYLFSHIDQLQTPFILFSAENEQIVFPYAHKRFVDAAKELGKDCVAYEVEDAQHELFMEKDAQRTETINETLHYYAQY